MSFKSRETVRVKIWTETSGERLTGNFAALRQLAASGGGAELLVVVKANAYGHGIEPCARILAEAGAEWLGVTDACEGGRVRTSLLAAGVSEMKQPKVLVMSGTAGLPGEAEAIVRERLTAVIWSAGHVERLAEASRAAGGSSVPVHLEIDSGMSRQGVVPGAELAAVLDALRDEPLISLNGVMTHFASTEVAHSAQTAAQRTSFEQALEQVAQSGFAPEWVHVGNSSFLDNEDGEGALVWLREVAARVGAKPMVRSGLALYGYVLDVEGEGVHAARGRVESVMTWKTRVMSVSEVPAGVVVGYNGTFRTEWPMRLALLPAGYADGLRRELSSTNDGPGGWVMIRGQRAEIVGRVSMNLTTVDVSGIPEAAEGDEVVLLGDGVSAEDHARLAGTIAYEILCGVKTS